MLLTLLDIYNCSRQFLLERANVLYHVLWDKPEGKVENKYWVEDREWDTKSK